MAALKAKNALQALPPAKPQGPGPTPPAPGSLTCTESPITVSNITRYFR